MEATATIKEEPAATKAATKPLKVIRLENVSASIFANKRRIKDEEVTFYNVSVSRSYKKDDQYRRTQSFAPEDLGKLLFVVKQAGDFIQNLQFPQPEGPVED